MSIDWKDDFYTRRRKIFAECDARMLKGSETYAKRDVAEDRAHLMARRSIPDLIEELFDTVNYAMTEIMRLQEVQRDIDIWTLKLQQMRVETEALETLKRQAPDEEATEWGG